jgi:hypothetical protein
VLLGRVRAREGERLASGRRRSGKDVKRGLNPKEGKGRGGKTDIRVRGETTGGDVRVEGRGSASERLARPACLRRRFCLSRRNRRPPRRLVRSSLRPSFKREAGRDHFCVGWNVGVGDAGVGGGGGEGLKARKGDGRRSGCEVLAGLRRSACVSRPMGPGVSCSCPSSQPFALLSALRAADLPLRELPLHPSNRRERVIGGARDVSATAVTGRKLVRGVVVEGNCGRDEDEWGRRRKERGRAHGQRQRSRSCQY